MKKLFYILIPFHISLFMFEALSQVSQEWVARYHFYSDDQQPYIALDNAGNVYVTGKSRGPGTDFDYATVKYNSSGVQLWVQRYNGPGNGVDAPSGIVVDDSGNVYVTGGSNSLPFPLDPNNDIATIKYNTNGILQWVRRYDGGSNEAATAGIVIDRQGYIYVGGRNAQYNADYLVIKYNSAGDSLWVRLWDSGPPDNQYDYPAAMGVDLSGNVYMTGAVGGIAPAPDWATVKWNSDGVFQWAQRYNGPGSGSDYAQSIAVSDSGNVYVTGYVWGNNQVECATIKYNTIGTLIWERVTGYPSAGLSITSDDTGNVYIAVASNTYTTIKYNRSGVQQWSSSLSNSNAQPCCVKLDIQGNVYVTGYATVATNNTDYCTIKYTNSGVQQWVMYYGAVHPNNLYDAATALAVDSQNNVYVTGGSIGDYATVKYSQLIGIIQISNEIPNVYKLGQNYPNPFNPMTNVKFQMPNEAFVKLIVFDVLGREIETLVNEELKPGTYEITFDGSNLPSGLYFYKLTAGNYNDTKKMILIK